jgi:hypothetical protein
MMLGAALELAAAGWPVFPLNGKVPAIATAAGGHGVLDATTDPEQITAWWMGKYRRCNIGARVPSPLVVIDIDPRHAGDQRLADLESEHGPLPATLTVWSGRGDLGRHLYYRRPAGSLSAARLGAGIDVKTSAGYCVVPPSVHPDSGLPYRWEERAPVVPPAWLITLLRPLVQPTRPRRPYTGNGSNIADTFSGSTSWAEVLQPHGWHCLDPDGDADGARWRHPAATAAHSATVRHGCLFVYTMNTPFEPTAVNSARGYTRFRAWAVLNHDGDLSAAARAASAGHDIHRWASMGRRALPS